MEIVRVAIVLAAVAVILHVLEAVKLLVEEAVQMPAKAVLLHVKHHV